MSCQCHLVHSLSISQDPEATHAHANVQSPLCSGNIAKLKRKEVDTKKELKLFSPSCFLLKQSTLCIHFEPPQTLNRPHPPHVKNLHITLPVNSSCLLPSPASLNTCCCHLRIPTLPASHASSHVKHQPYGTHVCSANKWCFFS